MSRCEQCGYQWPDVDENGELISAPYCHYEGPDEWAPCAQDDYEEDYDYEEDLREELGSMYDLSWDEEPTFEEYGAPYDYKEFQMERTVRVWIGNDYVEFEFEDNSDWTEDELYEAVVEDVYNSISVEIL